MLRRRFMRSWSAVALLAGAGLAGGSSLFVLQETQAAVTVIAPQPRWNTLPTLEAFDLGRPGMVAASFADAPSGGAARFWQQPNRLRKGGRLEAARRPVDAAKVLAALDPAPSEDGATPNVATLSATPVTASLTTPSTAAVTVTETMVPLAVALKAAEENRAEEGATAFIPAHMAMSSTELARSQKCLAEAIYFEARGESETGQYAVAQVVMNRVRSGMYPDTVCGVVYQNRHMRNRCQFSFACDGTRLRIRDQKSWTVASRIADEVLKDDFFMPEIGSATHYHATYVRPHWIRGMDKLERIGSHIFYRDLRWGSEEG